jgi:enoyl-CoA hydratase
LLQLESGDGFPRLEISVMDALEREIARLAETAELRGAVITGSEHAFAVGAEIAELARLTPTSALAFSRRGQAVLGVIASSAKPVVAAIAGDDAVFAHPGVTLGIITGWGGTQRLARLIGRGRAMEMFATGRRIRASEALTWGLVSGISADRELIAGAVRMARALAR